MSETNARPVAATVPSFPGGAHPIKECADEPDADLIYCWTPDKKTFTATRDDNGWKRDYTTCHESWDELMADVHHFWGAP